jgi:hypothetical protein
MLGSNYPLSTMDAGVGDGLENVLDKPNATLDASKPARLPTLA